jgi:hypothetical protein
MIVLVAPLAGFVLGLMARRWSVAWVAALILIALSTIGLPLGWFNSSDMEPLGGLIITAIFYEIPFLLAVSLGVLVRRSGAARRRGAF